MEKVKTFCSKNNAFLKIVLKSRPLRGNIFFVISDDSYEDGAQDDEYYIAYDDEE